METRKGGPPLKILFISAGGNTQDYLRDCVFHGLRSILGPDVVDVGKLNSMYVGADRSQMYGKGMTLYGELPDIPVDRTDILKKVAHSFFDLVIYGSIHRCQDLLHEVVSKYPPSRVVYIDGEDHPGYLKGLPGIYFKRELHNPQPGVRPIQFAIPKEKILKDGPPKSRLMAPMDPLDSSTYIYKDEASYYAQYASSYYAATMKKAGWDCLRHYEILSQWAIPYFRCLEACPTSIMARLPKRELMVIKDFLELPLDNNRESLMKSLYDYLIEPIMETMRSCLTTEALARSILDTAKAAQ